MLHPQLNSSLFGRFRLPGALLTLASAASAWSASPWLPGDQQWQFDPGFTFSTFDSFWMGTTKIDNPPNGKSLDQYTGFIGVTYGFTERCAADVTLGYTATDTDAFGGESDSGLADTQFGVRYALVDEFDSGPAWRPTVTLRLGGILAGSYDENTPFAPGDGAHGFESELLLGKAFGDTGFGLFGGVGYRVRTSPTPDDFLASAGAYQRLGPVTLSASYRHIQGLDGLDIGGPGFDPSQGNKSGFPALKEINQLFEASLGFTDAGDRYYAFSFATSLDGRNTGDKMIFGFLVSIPFGGR